MLNTLTPSAPVPASSDVGNALALLVSLADPATAKKRLADLDAATKAHNAAAEKAKTALAELEKSEPALKARLDKLSAEHDRKLARSQADQLASWADREKAVAAAEVRVRALEEKAKREADESEKLKASLEARIRHLRIAAGAGDEPLTAGEKLVFGVDAKRAPDGSIIAQGIG
jgi:chromosome segregation ATPase